MTGLQIAGALVGLAGATCFVIGLHLMRNPRTARRGNAVSAAGMTAVIAMAVVVGVTEGAGSGLSWALAAAGAVVGAALGVRQARTMPMTAMPQLVSLFNAVGGGAAALIAASEYLRADDGRRLAVVLAVPLALDVIIGSVTLAGSLVAAGKLQGIVPGRPIVWPGARVLTGLAALVAVGGAAVVVAVPPALWVLCGTAVGAAVFGVLMVLPIGGADAPVVVSLLNAFTGLAVAMAGFVIDDQALIIGGGLVGAAGTILTLQMAAAMNRSVPAIMVGGFGTGDSAGPGAGSGATAGAGVRTVDADDVAVQLAYAGSVVVVPGYGLAAGQAQHEIAELYSLLSARGIRVTFAIHPVAGRMPGHMNVLLAEAGIPYEQLLQLDEANAALASCDIAVVVGANDVTNPAARRPGTAISGMPILDVDHARAVVVIKRSMSPGYAGIDNELFTDPRTGMFFADAKQGLARIIAAVKQYLPS